MKRFAILIILGALVLGCSTHMSAREIAKMVTNRIESIKTLKCTIVEKYDNTTEITYSVLKFPDRVYDKLSSGEIYIRNGTKYWDYYNGVWHESNVTETINRTNIYMTVLSILRSNNLTFEGIKRYHNRACYVLKLQNSTENIEMWIDSKLLFPVLIKVYSNGHYDITEFKNVQINVPVNDSLFLPPKNAKVVHENVTKAIYENLPYNNNVEVLVWKGIKRMNSKEISNYLSFAPTIPKGWKAICGNLYIYVNNTTLTEVDLVCVNGSKPYRIVSIPPNTIDINYSTLHIVEKPISKLILESLSSNNYTTIDGVKVYTIRLCNTTIPIGFSKSGIWYSVNWPFLNESEQLKIVRDLIEHPVTFGYRIPISVTKVYELNRTNVKQFVEKRFKHRILLPYFNKTLVEIKNSTSVFRVIAYLGGVNICNKSVILGYSVVESLYNSSSSWTTTSSLMVNESLTGKIPSNAKEIKLGSITVWMTSNKGINRIYAKRDNLTLTFTSFIGSPASKYLLKFVKNFLSCS